MELSNMFDERNIDLSLHAENKEDAFRKMAIMLYDNEVIDDVDAYHMALMEREEEFSTGIGYGIAIPHARCDTVKKVAIAIAKLDGEIDYASFDDEPISMLFMIAVPSSSSDEHIKILSILSRKFMHEEFRESLRKAQNKTEIMELLKTT